MEETSLQIIPNYELLTKYLSTEQVEEILAPTPEDAKRTVDLGTSVTYVPARFFVAKYNKVFGFLWSHRVLKSTIEGNDIVTLNEVTFHIPGETKIVEHKDGSKETTIRPPIDIVKTQYGGIKIKRFSQDHPKGVYKAGEPIDLGNAYKGSATDGLKKCGLEFGFFSDLYVDDSIPSGREKIPSVDQLEAVYFRGDQLGWTREEIDTWSLKEVQKETIEDITKLETIKLVARLIDLKGTSEDKNKK